MKNAAYGFYFTFNKRMNVAACVNPNVTAIFPFNKTVHEVFYLIENDKKGAFFV